MSIQTIDDVTEFPLVWPDNKPRAAQRIATPFKTSIAKAQQEIRWEISRWRARNYVISMAPQYRQGAIDPGVALWWEHPVIAPGERAYRYDLRVLACDTYQLREANLHAIALTLERLRSLERYGTYSMEQAIEGARLALPPPATDKIDWPKVLGVKRSWPIDAIETIYRQKIGALHPDQNDTDGEELKKLTAAIDAARKEKGARPSVT